MAGTPSSNLVPYTDEDDALINNIDVMANLNPSLLGDSTSQEYCWDFSNMSRDYHVVGINTNGKTTNQINEPNLGNIEILNNTINPSTTVHTTQHVAVPQDPYSQPLSIPIDVAASQDLYSVVWGASMMRSSQSAPSNFNGTEMNNSRPTNLGTSRHGAVMVHPNSPIPGGSTTAAHHIQNPTNLGGMYCNELNLVVNPQGGPSSEVHSEKIHIQPEMNAGQPPVWPTPRVVSEDDFPLDCTMLKEITHHKGCLTMNLELYGNFTLGLYSHAIHHIHDQITGATSTERFEFAYDNEVVKRFLSEYYIQRKKEGYVPVQDPRSLFFDILSMNGHHDNNDHIPGGMGIDEAVASDSNTKEKQSEDKAPIDLAAQRQRVKNITMDEISQFFHLPRKEAAKRLGLSETVLTKIMHKHDTNRRWPYRKVKALQKGISDLKSRLTLDDNGQESVSAMNEIQRKEEEMAELYKKEE